MYATNQKRNENLIGRHYQIWHWRSVCSVEEWNFPWHFFSTKFLCSISEFLVWSVWVPTSKKYFIIFNVCFTKKNYKQIGFVVLITILKFIKLIYVLNWQPNSYGFFYFFLIFFFCKRRLQIFYRKVTCFVTGIVQLRRARKVRKAELLFAFMCIIVGRCSRYIMVAKIKAVLWCDMSEFPKIKCNEIKKTKCIWVFKMC